jgi:glutamate/tyrosine decarboxylase-like PLP-dependent enzyme
VKIGKDLKIDVRQMKKRIDSNTVCLVASAPEYAFGFYDPIPQIAALA